jgi:hypothetical protein
MCRRVRRAPPQLDVPSRGDVARVEAFLRAPSRERRFAALLSTLCQKAVSRCEQILVLHQNTIVRDLEYALERQKLNA